MTNIHHRAWTPDLAGETCAQELYTGERDPARILNEYRWQVKSYYKDSGYAAHNPEKALASTLRWAVRAISAPLLLGIEKELATHVRAIQAPDGEIPAKDLSVNPNSAVAIRKRIQNGRSAEYSDRQWAFLETVGHMSYQAGIRFLAQTHNEPQNRIGRLFTLFTDFDTEVAAIYPVVRGFVFKMRHGARERLLDNVITSNSTVLHTLEVARRSGVEREIRQLGWLATTSLSFFNTYFGDDCLNNSNTTCPFATEERRQETGMIWDTPPLNEGQWPSRRYCPENVPLWDGVDYVTAATKRLESVAPIAKQLLWRS